MPIETYDSAVHVVAGVLGERGLSNDPGAVVGDLDRAGLLDGGDAEFPNPTQAAVNVLGCRMGWSDAFAVVESLESGGLLVDPAGAR